MVSECFSRGALLRVCGVEQGVKGGSESSVVPLFKEAGGVVCAGYSRVQYE